MNPVEEIEMLKERVSVLERILLRKPHFIVQSLALDNQEV